MQSFRQFRAIKRQLNEQIRLHGIPNRGGYQTEKCGSQAKIGPIPNPESGSQHRRSESSPSCETEVSPIDDSEKDLEKAGTRESPYLQAANLPPSGRVSIPTEEDAGEPECQRKQARALDKTETAEVEDDGDLRAGKTLTGVNVRPRTTREGGGNAKVFVVGFQGEDDDLNPHNWPWKTRAFAMFQVGLIGWIVGFASSIDSSALPQAAEEFGVSRVTESLATGLFLIAFGVGSLIAGPFSEEFGRNPVYIFNLIIFMIFTMAAGLAPNIGAQLTFRFFAGFFGSTPLTCAGGSLSDLFTPKERVIAFPLFATSAFIGPMFGPVVGGFVAQSHTLTWRWTEWITLIITGCILVSIALFQPETYSPILLKYKAQLLREATGDDRFVAAIEVRADTFGLRVRRALYRPFLFLIREPIIVLFGLYLSVVYIVLFGFLDGYDFIFGETYGLSQGLTGLAFLGIAIGVVSSASLVPLMYHWYCRALARAQTDSVTALPPELRLWWAMIGAPVMPVSLFWLGWTARPDISVWSPLAATVGFGFSTLCIFISCYQYLIDCYEVFAASALASATVLRYLVCGGMVVVGIPMYSNLGVHWALTIMGALSAVMVPVPFLFYRYGEKIRGWSKFAVD